MQQEAPQEATGDELANFIRYKEDPWAFLAECIYTQDQVDAENPIKLYPWKRLYLRFCVMLFQKYRFLAFPKSRRMTMSWTILALILWDTMFHQGRFWAVVSKKEEDAKELLDRIAFMFNHIPPARLPKQILPKLDQKGKPPTIHFAQIHSKIQGFPQGADQLRQFTFSGIFGDECVFWPDAQKFYSASKPTLDGGGRMILVSSPGPGFFKKLVFDTLKSDIDAAIPHAPTSPMQGIRIWKNPDNRFLVCEIHYTADPAKRDPSFKKFLSDSLPRREYLQEYELHWDSFEGMPVYMDFGERHLLQEKPEPHMGLPLLLGWDFGRTPSAIIGQVQGNQLVIIREFVAKNKSIALFAPEVMTQLRVLYPNWHDNDKHFRHYIDPAGFNKSELDEVTCAQQMEIKAGIKQVFPGAPPSNNFEARYDAVEERLVQHTSAGPGIVLYEATAPVLTKGFRGGYMYPEKAQEIEPNKLRPEKNNFSHPHDALQYLSWGTKQDTAQQLIDIPTASYGFLQTKTRTNDEAPRYGYEKDQNRRR